MSKLYEIPRGFQAPTWRLARAYPLPDEEYQRRERTEAIIVHHSQGQEWQSVDEIRTFHVRPVRAPEEWLEEFRDRWLARGGDPATWERAAADLWRPGRGWLDVGYQVLIQDGVAHAGRPEWAWGSHAPGWNDRSVGVCLVGDYTFRDPPFPQRRALIQELTRLLQVYPGARIMRHDEAVPNRTCPGGPWLAPILERLAMAGLYR